MYADRPNGHGVAERPFHIGPWRVDPQGGTLSRDGSEVRIEPRVMDVLCHLAANPGKLVTRAELEREVWRGAVVRYDAVTGTIIKLRRALGDVARNPNYIATIPKRGYRLIAPVDPPEEAAPTADRSDGSPRRTGLLQPEGRTPRWTRVVVLATLMAAAAWLLLRNGPPDPPPGAAGSTSLLVLPLATVGDEPVQVRLAEGLTADLITDLSGFSTLRVLAVNTSFSYRERELEPSQIGTALGVGYVLDGTIQLSGETIRLNIRLIDTRTGFQQWAARYDRRLDELFSTQDELADHIVHALGVELTDQETARLAHVTTDNLSAYEHFLEGQRLANTNTEDDYQRAQAAYREAISLDPHYGRAYGALAFTMGISYLHGWTDTPVETLDRALELALKAVALDGAVPQTHWVLGYTHMVRKEYELAERAVRRSIEVSPSFADGYGMLALLSNNLGRPERAIEMINRGMELNPHYTWAYLYNLGRAYYATGRHAEAIDALEQAVQRNGNRVEPRLFLAASYMQLDRIDDAEWEVENIRLLSAAVTRRYLRDTFPIREPAQMEMLLADLRRAGLPE